MHTPTNSPAPKSISLTQEGPDKFVLTIRFHGNNHPDDRITTTTQEAAKTAFGLILSDIRTTNPPRPRAPRARPGRQKANATVDTANIGDVFVLPNEQGRYRKLHPNVCWDIARKRDALFDPRTPIAVISERRSRGRSN